MLKIILISILFCTQLSYSQEKDIYDEIINSSTVQTIFKYINFENDNSCDFSGEETGTTIRRLGSLLPPFSEPTMFSSGHRFFISIICPNNKIIKLFGTRTNSYVEYPSEWEGERPNIRSWITIGRPPIRKLNYVVEINEISY